MFQRTRVPINGLRASDERNLLGGRNINLSSNQCRIRMENPCKNRIKNMTGGKKCRSSKLVENTRENRRTIKGSARQGQILRPILSAVETESSVSRGCGGPGRVLRGREGPGRTPECQHCQRQVEDPLAIFVLARLKELGKGFRFSIAQTL